MVADADFLQVRREKISERMKLLQDLVPGCSKVHYAKKMFFLCVQFENVFQAVGNFQSI